MSGSSHKRASEPADRPKKKPAAIDLSTARQMLPLVRSIVRDIVDSRRRLTDLTREQGVLDQERRSLSWESRRRRYAVTDELTQTERSFATAVGELNRLGVTLTDADAGRVDFPTRINGRPASFSWQEGEEAVAFWRYSEEEQRRPIPADWQPGSALRTRRDV